MTTYSEVADRSMGDEREAHGGDASVPWLRIVVALAAMLLSLTLLVASGHVPPEPSEDFTMVAD